jgi:hypothetical protein
MTVHKAQGLTTTIALLYGTAALCQQAGYVGLSRGTDANHLYTNLAALTPNNPGIDRARFELLGPDPGEVRHRLAQRLDSGRNHTLAIDQKPEWQPDQEPARLPYPLDPYDHGRSR